MSPFHLGFESLEDRVVPSNFVTLHQFTGPTNNDGATPDEGLIIDSNGDLFGTTQGGGKNVTGIENGAGEVYELIPSNGGYTTKTLYAFSGGSNGWAPFATLLMDSKGDLFGSTLAGGDANGDGTIFELIAGSSGYTFQTIYTFTGGADGQNPSTGLIMDSNGDLFGTTGHGSNSYGTVFELTPESSGYTLNTLYTFSGGDDGDSPGALVLYDGNLFGTTYMGGTNGDGTVFELTPGSNGYTFNTIYTFTDGSDGAYPSYPLTVDSSGDLFGTAWSGGSDQLGTVFELTPGSSGYTFNTTYEFTGGAGGESPLGGVALDGNGNLFGTTTGGNGTDPNQTLGTVFELTPGNNGYDLTPLHVFTGGDGAIPSARLVLDSNGDVFGTTEEDGSNGDGTVFGLFNPPSVGSVSPDYGIPGGGTEVTITGTDLGNASGVDFGSVSGTIVSDSPTQIVATTKAEAAGMVDVTVTTLGGTSNTSDSDKFTFVQANPSFSDLSSPTIIYGNASTTISGTLDANADGQNVPSGETVQVTLGGVTQNAPLDNNDNFSTTFNTSTLGVSATPYSIGFSFAGDDSFTSASDTSTLTVNPATPSFSGLSALAVPQGTASTTISGTLDANAGSQLVPSGEMVQVTLNGVTQNATLESNDAFSTAFNTSALVMAAGPYTIGFSYGGDSSFNGATGSSSLTVTPGVVDPANSMLMIPVPTIQLGGVTAITLQARDAFGNDETSGGLKVSFALENSTGAEGTFNKAIDNKNGTYTSYFTGTLAGDNTVTATANLTAVASTQPIAVTGGVVSLAESTVNLAESQLTAGTTTLVTLQADYPKDNPEPAGGLTVLFRLGSTLGGQGTFSAVSYQGNGQYTAVFTGTLAGKNTIKGYIDGQAVTSVAPSIVVGIGTLSLATSHVLLSSSSMKANGTITVTLQPEDAGGNKLNLGENQTVVFSVVSGQGTFGQVTPHANGTYTATFTTTTEGNFAITAAINGQALTSKAPILAVAPSTLSLANSLVNVSPGTVQSGSKITVTLQAVDIYGNPETGNLAVAFKLKGGTGKGTFGKVTYAGNGIYQASFTGTIAGTNTIESTVGGALVESTAAIAVIPGPISLANSIVAVSPPAKVAIADTITITLQTRDAAGNDLTVNLLAEGISISFELGSQTGGQGLIYSVVYMGNGEYQATFIGSSVGSNTVLALIGGSKLTSKAPAIEITKGM